MDSFLLVVDTDYIQYLKRIQVVLVYCTMKMLVEDTYYLEELFLHYIHYVAACWEDSFLVDQTVMSGMYTNKDQ